VYLLNHVVFIECKRPLDIKHSWDFWSWWCRCISENRRLILRSPRLILTIRCKPVVHRASSSLARLHCSLHRFRRVGASYPGNVDSKKLGSCDGCWSHGWSSGWIWMSKLEVRTFLVIYEWNKRKFRGCLQLTVRYEKNLLILLERDAR
jgi:hypothetical protein